MRAWVALGAAVLLIAACSIIPGASQASPSPSPTGPPLDAPVQPPAGFPADFPVYTGARLTAGASFASGGQVTWGMEWETRDAVSKVQAYYARQLNQGDWTVKFTSVSTEAFAATFARKSNSHATGTLAGRSDAGITRILLSLVSPA